MSERTAAPTQPETEPAVPPESELPDGRDSHRLDTVFGMLQNERRRRVLEYLRDNETTTQSELAEHVAAIENGVPRGSLTSTQRKRVYVSLYQSHLPKLHDAGAVEYDPDRGTVERVPGTDEFLQYIDSVEAETRNPSVSRAGYTLGGAALIAVALAVQLLFGAGFGAVTVLALVLAGLGCGLVARGYAE